MQVAHFRCVVGRLIERYVGDLAVGYRNVEAVAEDPDVFIGQLLGLVHIVLALTALAHAKTLDRLDQQHGGLPDVLDGRVVGRVDLLRVVAATAQGPDVVVTHLGHHLGRLGITAKEMLAHVGTVVGLEGLVVAIERVHHQLAQGALLVARQQGVPFTAPQQFDDIPASPTKLAFQLLDDFAVAAHRAVQALQIAVDDKNQVIQLLARCQSNGTATLHLVHLAVAAEDPDLALRGIRNATRFEVLEKTRLVDRHQRPQAHGNGGELPEVGHQLGMRIARQALATDLLAEVQQLLLRQTPFQVGARIDAGRHMALDVEAVTTVVFTLCVPEMIEAGTKHVGQRGEGTDVPAQISTVHRVMAIGLDHHRHGVPAHVGAQAFLDFNIAWATLLLIGLYRVDVGRVGRKRHIDTALACMFQQLFKQEVGALWPLALNDGRERIHPLTGLLAVRVTRG